MENPVQHVVNIRDINGKDYANKSVFQINWDKNGRVTCILVDFIGDGMDLMPMYNFENPLIFKNVHGNLIGEFI